MIGPRMLELLREMDSKGWLSTASMTRAQIVTMDRLFNRNLVTVIFGATTNTVSLSPAGRAVLAEQDAPQ